VPPNKSTGACRGPPTLCGPLHCLPHVPGGKPGSPDPDVARTAYFCPVKNNTGDQNPGGFYAAKNSAPPLAHPREKNTHSPSGETVFEDLNSFKKWEKKQHPLVMVFYHLTPPVFQSEAPKRYIENAPFAFLCLFFRAGLPWPCSPFLTFRRSFPCARPPVIRQARRPDKKGKPAKAGRSSGLCGPSRPHTAVLGNARPNLLPSGVREFLKPKAPPPPKNHSKSAPSLGAPIRTFPLGGFRVFCGVSPPPPSPWVCMAPAGFTYRVYCVWATSKKNKAKKGAIQKTHNIKARQHSLFLEIGPEKRPPKTGKSFIRPRGNNLGGPPSTPIFGARRQRQMPCVES